MNSTRAENTVTRNFVEYFPTMSDFLAHTTHERVKAVQGQPHCGDVLSSVVDVEWAGGLNYAGAHKMATSGMAMDAKAMELRDKLAGRIRIRQAQATYMDVTGGSEVNMGAFVNGEPECVFAYRDESQKNRKTLAIVVQVCCSADYSPEEMRMRGAGYMALIDALESSGQFSCSVYVIGASQRMETVIKVKDCGERYDPQAVGFAIGHPGMLRQLLFGCWDLHPDRYAAGVGNSSYGMPMNPTIKGLKEIVGESEDCIDLSKRMRMGDAGFGSEKQIQNWVEEQLKAYDLLDEKAK